MGYQLRMRVVACSGLVLLCAACGPSGAPPGPSATTTAHAVDPAGIDRVRTRLPADYEIAILPKPTMPATFWGFAPGWVSDPTECGALATVGTQTGPRGWAASGPGGIVYALAASAPAPPAELRAGCAAWTVTGGHTTASVALGEGPQISDAQTLAITADATTRVENGTETHSHASTLVAYLDDLAVSVTVVTDPGAGGAALPEQLPAQLLGAAVQAIRGAGPGTR
ncbi:hypothetical protein ABIA30_002471 [Mycobacterium sp. MAA66]